jgi:HEAT repeat protein
MELHEIQTALTHPDFQYRLKAIAALKAYPSEVAVPLLVSKLQDSEFLVRSFVAMGLGHQKNADSFAALLEMLRMERDTNTQAEAASSLSLFGKVAAPHLVQTFCQQNNWLVRQTILACLADLEVPDELREVCDRALQDEDASVREAAVEVLARLANTSQQAWGLEQLLQLAQSDQWRIRLRVVRALKWFDVPEAREAIAQLRQDENHAVVGATLEEERT